MNYLNTKTLSKEEEFNLAMEAITSSSKKSFIGYYFSTSSACLYVHVRTGKGKNQFVSSYTDLAVFNSALVFNPKTTKAFIYLREWLKKKGFSLTKGYITFTKPLTTLELINGVYHVVYCTVKEKNFNIVKFVSHYNESFFIPF